METIASSEYKVQKQLRGHSMKLYKERVNWDVLKYSFGIRVLDPWNNLPEEVIATSMNMFKNKLNK